VVLWHPEPGSEDGDLDASSRFDHRHLTVAGRYLHRHVSLACAGCRKRDLDPGPRDGRVRSGTEPRTSRWCDATSLVLVARCRSAVRASAGRHFSQVGQV